MTSTDLCLKYRWYRLEKLEGKGRGRREKRGRRAERGREERESIRERAHIGLGFFYAGGGGRTWGADGKGKE